MKRFAIVSAIAAIVFATPTHSRSLYDIAPQMRKDVQCMYATLKKIPGIDHVRVSAADRQGWVYPYLEFRAASDKRGYRQTIDYIAEPDCTSAPIQNSPEDFRCVPKAGPYSFMTMLPGVNSIDEPGPNEWGTLAIEKRWKAECGVEAGGLFE